mgnify:FL=1
MDIMPKSASAKHVTPAPPEMGLPAELLSQGKALQRSGTPFVTAITVQKPRDLDRIVAAMDREAEYAGATFWYSWPQAGERIEGPTIGLANSLAREWGNCAATCELEETDEAFYITARFIDLESGFQMERVFRQRKSAVAGKYDPERKLDIALQIGCSKAIRNAIVNSVPRWLVERVIEKAKDALAKGISAEGLQAAADKCVAAFVGFKVGEVMLVRKVGKPRAQWTNRDVAALCADHAALKSGDANVVELFPPEEAPAPAGPVKLEEVMKAVAKPPAEATVATTINFVCPTCAAQFAEEQTLKAHVAEKHPAAKKNGLFG